MYLQTAPCAVVVLREAIEEERGDEKTLKPKNESNALV